MIAALAGRWLPARDARTDDCVRALAARRGEVPVEGGPFLFAGHSAVARSSGGCLAAIAGCVSDVIDGDGAAPAAWLAAAYERSGQDVLASLRGEFLVILWDPRRRTGVLARDQLGGRCLQYRATSGGLVFAEEIRDLLALLPVRPEPDRQTVVALAASGRVPFGHSVYEGVHRLPPGHLLRFCGDRWTPQQWWRPRYRGVHAGSADELAQRVVSGLDRAVGRCTEGEAVAVLLSGGLDSSAVASSAALQAPTRETRPVAYSGVFPHHPRTDEAPLIDEILASLGIRGVRRIITGGSAVAGALDHLRDWGVPSASPNNFLWRPLLARARSDGFRLLLDGEGGDELFGVSQSVIVDRLRHGRAVEAWRLTRHRPGVGPTARRRRVARLLVQQGLQHALAPARRLGGRLRDPARLVPELIMSRDAPGLIAEFDVGRPASKEPGPLWWREQAHAITDARELFDAHGYLRRRAAEAGLESRHPLLHDVDLVELVLSLPPEPRLDPDHSRVLLRRGLAGRLPDSVRLRRRKSYFNALLDDALAGDDGLLLRDLLGDRDAEIRAYVRGDMLDARILSPGADGFPDGRSAWSQTVWRLGNLELWLRSLRDPGLPLAWAERLPAPAQDDFEEIG